MAEAIRRAEAATPPVAPRNLRRVILRVPRNLPLAEATPPVAPRSRILPRRVIPPVAPRSRNIHRDRVHRRANPIRHHPAAVLRAGNIRRGRSPHILPRLFPRPQVGVILLGRLLASAASGDFFIAGKSEAVEQYLQFRLE